MLLCLHKTEQLVLHCSAMPFLELVLVQQLAVAH
jgi:hypothetical protein